MWERGGRAPSNSSLTALAEVQISKMRNCWVITCISYSALVRAEHFAGERTEGTACKNSVIFLFFSPLLNTNVSVTSLGAAHLRQEHPHVANTQGWRFLANCAPIPHPNQSNHKIPKLFYLLSSADQEGKLRELFPCQKQIRKRKGNSPNPRGIRH